MVRLTTWSHDTKAQAIAAWNKRDARGEGADVLRQFIGSIIAALGEISNAEATDAIMEKIRVRPQSVEEGFMSLTDAQRVAIMQNVCRWCGSVDPTCQCWNDE